MLTVGLERPLGEDVRVVPTPLAPYSPTALHRLHRTREWNAAFECPWKGIREISYKCDMYSGGLPLGLMKLILAGVVLE